MPTWAAPATTSRPRRPPTGATGTPPRRSGPPPASWRYRSPGTATGRSAGRGAQGQHRPLRRRVPRDIHVRARDVAARHRPDRPGDLRLLDERRDRLGDNGPRVGGPRALEVEAARAGLRLHVRRLPLRARARRSRRAQRRRVRGAGLRPARAQGRPGPVDGRLRGRPPLDAGVRRAQGPGRGGRPLRRLRRRGRARGGPGGRSSRR